MASFTNFATLSYNGGTTNSNTVTGELLEALTVTKTAVVKNYARLKAQIQTLLTQSDYAGRRFPVFNQKSQNNVSPQVDSIQRRY